jgi:hypothetical protein
LIDKLPKSLKYGKINERLNNVPLRHHKQPTLVYISHDQNYKRDPKHINLHVPMPAMDPLLDVESMRKLLQGSISSKMIVDLVYQGRL